MVFLGKSRGVPEGKYYPNHEAIDFIIVTKGDIALLRKWALSVFGPLLPGRGFS